MTEKERIEKVMQMESMNSAIFANAIGIQGSTLSHILNGRNNPSLSVLQSILNRFPNINPEWLIMGQGSIERAVKQPQSLTLFDTIEETSYKSMNSVSNTPENKSSEFSSIQPKNQVATDFKLKPELEQLSNSFQPPVQLESPSKLVRKIIVYYTDNTFQEFETK